MGAADYNYGYNFRAVGWAGVLSSPTSVFALPPMLGFATASAQPTLLLLRLLLDDDPAQNAKTDALMGAHATRPESVMLTDVVLTETFWTLRTVYRCRWQPKSALVGAIQSLLAQPAFAFENRVAVEQAVATFSDSNSEFSDCLIAAKLMVLGYNFTATFDKRMHALPGVKVC